MTDMSVEDAATIDRAEEIIRRRGNMDYNPDALERAACKGKDTSLFFAKRGKFSKAGKEICKQCPVWVDCLLMAMSSSYSLNVGTYGRVSPFARETLAKRLKIKPTPMLNPVEDYYGTAGYGLAFSKERIADKVRLSGGKGADANG